MKTGSVLDNIRPAVRAIAPYTLTEYEYDLKINQNENPVDVPASLKRELLDFALERSWSRYPPFVPETLRQGLAGYTGWPAEGILVGNGSNELIQALLAVFLADGDRLVIPSPTFTVYQLVGTVYGAEAVTVPLNSDFTFDTAAVRDAFLDGGDMLIVCSPNNPTGAMFPADAVADICEATSKPVIVDEAYYEFAGESVLPLLAQYDNLIVLRTFSKAFSLAGLRVGYGLMSPAVAAEAAKAKLPYNLNFFSMAAAEKLLANRTVLSESIETIVAERDRLIGAMNAIDGVTAHPSRANFILFETPFPPKQVFESILRDGILIRDVSSYPMLANALRVTVGMPDGNTRFLDALSRTIATLKEDTDQ